MFRPRSRRSLDASESRRVRVTPRAHPRWTVFFRGAGAILAGGPGTAATVMEYASKSRGVLPRIIPRRVALVRIRWSVGGGGDGRTRMRRLL